jgi:beta-lactamase class A
MRDSISRRSFLETMLGEAIGLYAFASCPGALADPVNRVHKEDESHASAATAVCEKNQDFYRAPVSAADNPDPSEIMASKKTLTQMLADHESTLRSKGRLAADERTSWSVYDITAGKSLAEIDSDSPLQAASMMKPFVAMLFFDAVKEGKMQYTPAMRRKLTKMMQKSDNRATSELMRMLGGPEEINRNLHERYGHIFHDVKIVEYVPRSGKTYRNLASAGDYTRFLSALWNRQIPYSDEILRLMSLPNGDRVKKKTRLVPKKTPLYHKTGSTNMLCGDAAILAPKGADGTEHPYIIVGIIQKGSHATPYRSWIRARGNIIREMSDIVYSDIRRKNRQEDRGSYLR